jgi:hypothetical protein
MKALTNFGGCSTDWPKQEAGTCCVANNKLNASNQEQCPALANCFPNAESYDCHILTAQCAPFPGSKGEFPTLQSCETACSKVPTPAPPPPTCTGESANLTAGDCAAWTGFAKDPHFSSVLVAKVREFPRYVA